MVTVAALNKTAHDGRQGEIGATVQLEPDFGALPDYFGIFKNGDTNPIVRNLKATSQDGGVLWANAPGGCAPAPIAPPLLMCLVRGA